MPTRYRLSDGSIYELPDQLLEGESRQSGQVEGASPPAPSAQAQPSAIAQAEPTNVGAPPSAPTTPSEPDPGFFERMGRKISEANQAAANIPHAAGTVIAGGDEGRFQALLDLISGAASPISATLSPIGAAVEKTARRIGSSESTARTAGSVGEVGASLGLGLLGQTGKLSAAGRALNTFLNGNTEIRDSARSTIREEGGAMTRERAQQVTGLAQELKNWDRHSPDEALNFMDAVERGKTIELPVDQQELAGIFKKEFDSRRAKVEQMSERDDKDYFQSFVQHYWPHIWDNPQKAGGIIDKIILNRTASEGSKAFLHDRSVDSIIQGVHDYGLIPKTFNPVEMGLMKIQEMDRFIMAHNIKDNWAESGMVMKAGKKGAESIPADWVRLNDRLFSGDRYYAPLDAAKSFNNYFSPGLMGNPVYDALKGVSNTMTMAQLGLSGFHGLVEAVNSSVSDLGLALKQVQDKQFGQAAANTARAASVIGSPIRDLVAGDRLMSEYLNPGSYSKYVTEAKAVATAGGRIGMDPIYLNDSIRSFQRAIRDGDWTKAVAKSLPALLEMTAKPMMNWYVPRVKLGAFQKMAAYTLEKAERESWAPAETKLALQKVWDSVDNRFGQLVYNNLFWHKAVKDLALIAVRAPGWNIGTIRELGGGVLDLASQSGRALADGKFDITHRMAYSIALPLFAGYIGGVINFLMTGEMPNGPRDHYYPRTGQLDINGNPDRFQLPSYIRDVMSLSHHPIRTVIGKLNPAITSTIEILQNKDFYNTEIRHPGDPIEAQAGQLARYLAEQMTPFSLRNWKQRNQDIGGGSLGTFIQSIAGVLPAPREFVKTPAENLASELIVRHLPAGPRTQQEVDQRDAGKTIEAGLHRGAIGVGDVMKAASKGTISHQQAIRIITNRSLPMIVGQIKGLNSDEAYQVFQAASPKERQLIYGEVSKKLIGDLRNNPESQEVKDRLLELSKGIQPSK